MAKVLRYKVRTMTNVHVVGELQLVAAMLFGEDYYVLDGDNRDGTSRTNLGVDRRIYHGEVGREGICVIHE